MKKLISLLTIFSLIVPEVFAASLRNERLDTTDGIYSTRNFAKNPSFEGPGTSNWTASAGTLTTTTAAANIDESAGATAGSWAATGGAGRTLDSSSVTITAGDGLAGANGVVSCKFKAASGTATHTIGIYDGTTLSSTTITSSTSGFVRTSYNFVFPSSGTVKLRISSVSATEPTLYIDSCFFGLAEGFNLGSVSQATLVGTSVWVQGVNQWSITTGTTSYQSFPANASIPSPTLTGSLTAPGTKIPAVIIPNAAPGNYYVVAVGAFGSSGTGVVTYAAISDGTTTGGDNVNNTNDGYLPNTIGNFTYTTAQTNLTFQLQSKLSTGTNSLKIGTGSLAADTLTILVYRFPTTSETVYRADQSDYGWTAYTPTIGGVGTATNVSFLQRKVGENLEVKGSFTAGTVAASLATLTLPTGLAIDTTKTTLANASNASGPTVGDYYGVTAATFGSIVTATGTSTSLVYFGNLSANSTNLIPQNGSAILVTGINVTVKFSVPISGWVGGIRVPVFVGSVTSGSTGAIKLEAGLVASGCASFTSQSTSGWATAATGGTGVCNLTFPAGTFSASPWCVCSLKDSGTASAQTCQPGSGTSTSFGFVTRVSGTATDQAFYVECTGPK